MDIWNLGHCSFKIKSKDVTLITDPYDSVSLGLKFPKNEANIITISCSSPNHNKVSNISGDPLVLIGPGEYEVKGVKIVGINSHVNISGDQENKNTIYQITMDDIILVHLGNFGKNNNTAEFDKIKSPDVLFVPIGGGTTLDINEALEIITRLDPKIVIPMYYKDAQPFLKLLGVENLLPQPKLHLVKEKIPLEREVCILWQN